MNDNKPNKYYPGSIEPRHRTDADPDAKELAERVVDTFDQEKERNPEKEAPEIYYSDGMMQLREEIEEHNSWSGNPSQLRAFISETWNTLMMAFVDRGENVADQVVSSKTPPEVTDREGYYDDMVPISDPPHTRANRVDNSDDSSSSGSSGARDIYQSPSLSASASQAEESPTRSAPVSQTEESSTRLAEASQAEESKGSTQASEVLSPSQKRKRDSDDEDQGSSSKRQNVEDYLTDTGPDLFDMAGD